MAPTSSRFALTIFLALAGSSANAQDVGGLPTLAKVMARDAELRDLSFVDAANGWAVGDRGVILRTSDGGRRWTALQSPVECPLYSVSFVDQRTGWVVGGFTKPYTHSSHAVVLKTEDGGESWRALPADTLPLLRRVKFFSARQGVAAGAGTSFAPGGVFETSDGGRTWRPLPYNQLAHWLAADFVAPGVGVVAGAAGELATTGRRELIRSNALAGDRRGLRDIALTGPTSGWMVGDGGLVLTTGDLGRTWQPPSGPTPPATRGLCDWRAIATRGRSVWIAGAPGSILLHSADAGASWQVQPTGVAAPISTIEFVDEQHGWAAGSLGTILATRDGGRTWNVQRRGGAAAAAVVLAAQPSATPLDLIATLGAAEGYFINVVAPFATGDPNRDSAAHTRQTEATIASGAALSDQAWRLSLRPEQLTLSASQLLAEFNRQTDGRGREELQRQIVTRLRTLRPEVVILATEGADSLRGVEQLLEDAARDAIAAAADPAQYPELGALGLSPHEVRRLVVAGPSEPRSSPRIVMGDFNPLLGTAPAQWVGASRALLTTEYTPAPAAITWRIVADAVTSPGATAAGRDPFAGIAIARGSDARRRAARPSTGDLAALKAIAQKTRNMRQLLSQSDVSDAWLGQALTLTTGLDADSGAELLYQLADGYRAAGKLDLAADTLYLLARRYTDHPLADSALLWLLRYYASSEVARAQTPGIATNYSEPPTENREAGVRQASATLAAPGAEQGALSRDERLERAAQLGKYLEQARPALFADPAVRFPIATAQRGLGFTASAEKYAALLLKQAVVPAWKRCGEAERWLAGQSELPPAKPIATCRAAAERPLLDGALDDPCWREAEALPIGGGESAGRGVVRLASDQEFFYIAIDCPRRTPSGEVSNDPRPRDGDLTGHDRVTILLDVDRDYAAAFELSIDSRGWMGDRCWGDRHWNPRWFVAAGNAAGRWTAEAAIPLAELAKEAPPPKTAWAVAAVRHTPGAAAESWTGVADEASPDRFGLLLFP